MLRACRRDAPLTQGGSAEAAKDGFAAREAAASLARHLDVIFAKGGTHLDTTREIQRDPDFAEMILAKDFRETPDVQFHPELIG